MGQNDLSRAKEPAATGRSANTQNAVEIWAHTRDSSIELKAHGWSLCLTDPQNATRNGTQLVVSSCRNMPDQHWSMP